MASRKLSLPTSLLKEIGAQPPPDRSGRGRSRNAPASRKDQRKAHRDEKRLARRPQPRHSAAPAKNSSSQHRKPITAKTTAVPAVKAGKRQQSRDEDDDEDDDDEELQGLEGLPDDDSLSEGDFDSDESESEQEEQPRPSKSVQNRLDKDDAEIAALEKKLGLKGRSSLPKSFEEDGLGDLLGDIDEDPTPEKGEKRKRDAGADEWLAQKRRKAEAQAKAQAKAAAAPHVEDNEESDSDLDGESGSDDLDGLDDILDDGSELDDDEDDEDGEEGSDDGFDGFSDQEVADEAPRQRENPYVAPTTGVAKYVPPSLRKQGQSSNEVEAQLRRRIQGLVNRLTNDSMVGITKDLLVLYNDNPRQIVTTAMVDTVLALVCSGERRPDSFFTMVAGFITAAHRAMGMAITAHFIQQLVELFAKHYDNASGDHSDAGSKHLITLLAELYNMQIVGSNLVFDYVRLFLDQLSELDTELLLRIIQLCGPALRREDPHALQEIVNRISPAKLKNASVRTSFMIDEMKKLQGNKAKAAARNRDLVDQRTQIKKRITTLGGSQDTQPIRLGLKDIQDADKNGKWWLVGASWAGKQQEQDGAGSRKIKATNEATQGDAGDDGGDDDTGFFGEGGADDELDMPDLWLMAKQQGFNTDVRQRIFVALHAAVDYENADVLVRKLKLNKHQRKEIAEVIVRSCERQREYNPYYALVATRFVGDKETWFQFRRSLAMRFKKMGEDVDTGGDDGGGGMGEEEEDAYDMRWLFNAARMYGSLIAMQCLRLGDVLKHRNLAALRDRARLFVEVVLLTALRESDTRRRLGQVFGAVTDPDLARGLQWFLRKRVRGTDLLEDAADRKKVRRRCEAVEQMLQSALLGDSQEA